jgi:hypothetical protein
MDLRVVSATATSATWLWPMIVGGLLLGVGFIVSGYCPGTSLVAMASGKLDGVATVVGVILGTLLHAELMALPGFVRFMDSGFLGQVYLYELVKLPPPVVALFVAVMAVGCFLGAEKLEAIFAGEKAPVSPRAAKKLVFAGFGAFAAVGLASLALPRSTAATPAPVATISAPELARRALAEPWKLRILDVRPMVDCAKERVPGAECTPADTLKKLELADVSAARDLVVVTAGPASEPPAEARAYRGRVLLLENGFEGWREWALAPAPAPAPGAPEVDQQAWRLRSGIRSALTGVGAPPPPAAPAGGAGPAKRKAGGGGCSG